MVKKNNWDRKKAKCGKKIKELLREVTVYWKTFAS